LQRLTSIAENGILLKKRENRYLKELRKIAAIESIGSSTRIEGATMTTKSYFEVPGVRKNTYCINVL
jgi:hypothetical protein